MTDYLVYDVFTDTAFGGNPLAVIPDAAHLPEDRLQKIAREFNFSETVFVYPSEDASAAARLRIFTPTLELAFAGHPTVGAAVALHAFGRIGEEAVLELGVGPIPVTVSDGCARFVTRVPLETEDAPPTGRLAACVGLAESEIVTARHQPVSASLGTAFVLMELASEDALGRSAPVTDQFRNAAGPDADRLAVFVYVREDETVKARMFQPLGGIPEDPATGSAAAALAAFLGRLEGRSMTLAIDQGVEMGRPSRIDAEVTVETGDPVAVAIGGAAVKVMEGRLTL